MISSKLIVYCHMCTEVRGPKLREVKDIGNQEQYQGQTLEGKAANDQTNMDGRGRSSPTVTRQIENSFSGQRVIMSQMPSKSLAQ